MAALRRFVGRYYSLLILAALWEALPRLGLIKYVLLPPLTDVLLAAVEMTLHGRFGFHLGQTLLRMGAGVTLAALVGVPLGVLMAAWPNFRAFLYPLISFWFPVPKVGIYPAFLILFGFLHASKIALVFSEAVFPIVFSTFAGAAQVNPKLIWSATAMGTPQGRLLWRVVVPSALPHIMTGLRVAVIVSLIGVFIAEMVASAEGLGHLMMYSARKFETAQMFVAIITVSLAGLLFDGLLLRVRRRALRWHAEAEMH